MIVVDSSVLISLINGDITPAAHRFRDEINPDEVLIGDIVLLEILQGARSDVHAKKLERMLESFQPVRMLNVPLALKSAENYRRLRALGYTVRKTADLIIGTFCIERGHRLLHKDRDFDPMVEHLGLQTA